MPELGLETLVSRFAGPGWVVVSPFSADSGIVQVGAGDVEILVEEMVPPGGALFIDECVLEHIDGTGLEVMTWFLAVNRRRIDPYQQMRGRAATGLAPVKTPQLVRGGQKISLGVENTDANLAINVAGSWTAWLLERR